MFHNVLSRRLTNFLKNDKGRQYFARWIDSEHLKVYLYTMANIYENTSEDALRALQLTSRITGLKTTKRPIRSHVYAPGGHIGVHADTVRLLPISSCVSQ